MSTSRFRDNKKNDNLKSCRYDASGAFDDVAFGLARDWLANERPTPTLTDVARRLNVARTTVRRNLARKVEPSKRARKAPPVFPRGKKTAIARRRRALATIAAARELIVGPKGPRGGKLSVEIRRRQFPTSSCMLRELRKANIVCSPSTVRRDLLRIGFVSRVRPLSARLWQSDMDTRLAFAKQFEDTDSSLFLFSDEKWINVDDHGRHREWRKPTEAPTRRETQGRYAKKLHVWGMIGCNGVRKLVFFSDGPVNGVKYLAECLKPCRAQLRCAGRQFIQDGARCHIHKDVKQWLASSGVQCPDWPAHSPDLSPIENFWGHVQRLVDARGPTNDDDLRRMWKEEWDGVPQATVDKFVLSFAGRLKRCVAARGAAVM